MKRSPWIVLIPSLVIITATVWFVLAPKGALPDNLMDTVPADAYGAVRIRVDRVLASEAWKRLVVERGEARGMQRVTKACGFNPLARLTEVVVFARPAADGGWPNLAFAARGDLPHGELVRCVQKVTGADSNKLRREEIEGIPTVASSKGSSRAAFVGRDGIVGGDAQSVRSAILTMQGKAPKLLADATMNSLFQHVEGGQDLAGVARLPEPLRPQLRGLATRILGGQLAPLAEVRALAGNVHLADARLAGGATLVAANATQATALVDLARAQIARLLGIAGVALTPAGGVLRGIQTEANGNRATFTGQVNVSTVEALLELLPALAQLRESLAAPAPAAPPSSPGQGPAGSP